MSLTNSVSLKRVGVIYDAHIMNINSQNALLKTLEEVPENKYYLVKDEIFYLRFTADQI